ncbi:ABC transporter E family member 2-like protein [Tanacetum coccineum]
MKGSKCRRVFKYSTMTIAAQYGFKLKVAEGEFADSEIIVLLGQDGTGRQHLSVILFKALISSIMPLTRSRPCCAPTLSKCGNCYAKDIDDANMDPPFVTEVIEPLQIEQLMDRMVSCLSCEEIQRLALCVHLGLGKLAHIYIIDEPSAYHSPSSMMLPQQL